MQSGDHMAIIVEIDNVKYYVDCGAPARFFKPVAFEENPLNETEFGSDMIRITSLDQAHDLYEYVRFSNGERSGNSWKFNANEKQEIEDFNEIIRNSNQVGAPFMRILRCQIWQTKEK
jgi:N-hydroxyarylamine O-acetyltransferase